MPRTAPTHVHAFALALALGACTPTEPSPSPSSSSSTAPTSAPSPSAKLARDELAAASRLTATSIAAPLRFLSDDLLEGRLPGTRGDDIAIKYIAAEMESYGLEPGAADKTWFQKVPLVGIQAQPPRSVAMTAGAGSLELSVPDDLVVMSGTQNARAAIEPTELVFVGYGIVAPEYHWDDYKDVDVKGKVVVVMNDDPSSDPKLFAGKTRLWYGRWDYKYEQAAKKGAAGVIIIHTTPSAAYPWQVVVSSNTGERFELPAVANEPRLVAKMWATEEATRKVVAFGGKDLDALRASAETREFKPTPLGVKMSLALTNKTRNVESANVVGVLRGRDPKLAADAIVYTAHHDHLGVGIAKNGDAIYNGALDNASGVAAMLSIARAASLAKRPRRSLVFVAVTAEEQGLLGSEYYCAHPTFAPGHIAANVNIDSVNNRGKTTDLGYIGFGKSSLDAVVVAVASAQGRVVRGDPYPTKGTFYRSDQFNFAKIGVPAIYLRGGPSYVGKPAGWGEEQAKLFEQKHYHQPSDEYDGTWDLGGAVEDAQLLLVAGLRIANATALPMWNPRDEFEAARKVALAGR